MNTELVAAREAIQKLRSENERLRNENTALRQVIEEAESECDIYSLNVKKILEDALKSDLGNEDSDIRIGELKGYMRDVLYDMERGDYGKAFKNLKWALRSKEDE